MPVAIVGGSALESITAGGHHTCGLDGDAIYCWGDNDFGQLGVPGGDSSSLVRVSLAAQQITAGGDHTCALSDGRVFCWGNNAESQIGDRPTGYEPMLVPIPE